MTVVLDSVTDLSERHRGSHVLVGSHGGLATGAMAARAGVSSIVFSDAGVGLDRAGIAALQFLADREIPAASVSHTTARIGDANDMLSRGHISWANALACDLGVSPDQTAAGALVCLERFSRTAEAMAAPNIAFARSEIVHKGTMIVLCDSASQIRLEDKGLIVVTGSHGGLPGLEPARASKADVAMVFYNDAGIGVDSAGTSRLPALDDRKIPSACVDCMSARIGEAHSTFDTGVLTAVNRIAGTVGLERGQSVQKAIEKFVSSKRKNS